VPTTDKGPLELNAIKVCAEALRKLQATKNRAYLQARRTTNEKTTEKPTEKRKEAPSMAETAIAPASDQPPKKKNKEDTDPDPFNPFAFGGAMSSCDS